MRALYRWPLVFVAFVALDVAALLGFIYLAIVVVRHAIR